jgi:hypothetical protein
MDWHYEKLWRGNIPIPTSFESLYVFSQNHQQQQRALLKKKNQ